MIKYVGIWGVCAGMLLTVHRLSADETEERAVERLLQKSTSGTSEERVEAIDALGQRGAAAAPAVEGLIKCLQDKDVDVRCAAARALGSIGSPAKRAVPDLIQRFGDAERNRDEIPVWHSAAEAVARFGPDPLPELIKLLAGAEDIPSHAAAVAIHGLGAAGKPAVPAAIEQLQQDKPTRRIAMIYAIWGIGPAAEEAVPVLIRLLDLNEDFHAQYWSCRALGKIGLPAAKPAVPTLVRLVRHPVASVRGNAAAALGNLGPDAGPAAVAALTEALSDKLYNVRSAAAVALGQMGPLASTAVPALDAGLARTGFAARSQAAVARWRITQEIEPTITVLLAELEGRDAPWDAAAGFQQMGARAEPAVERLIKLFESSTSETRLFAASSLAGIGYAARPALPKLRALRNDPDQDVRAVAAEAVRTIEAAQAR